VILSAKDSTGLEAWLQREKYSIPAGAEPLLRPYVEGGSKWFVAKVDPAKVKFVDGRAALSPLRFHYDTDELALPIRLGLVNSSGTQDLIVNILAPHQRYEVANGKNVTIPTNIDISQQMKDRFAAFYTALFDRTIEKNPGAVITEYAWQATTCDPCPGPALDPSEFQTLGADVLAGDRTRPARYDSADFVLTRLHARYGKTVPNGGGAPWIDDLRFKEAPPIVGGRESVVANGKLEEGAQPASENNFQARYAIRYPWTGPITCDKPRRGVWGAPPPELAGKVGSTAPRAATNLAFAPRSEVALAAVVLQDVPEIDLRAGASKAPAPTGSSPGSAVAASSKKRGGCGCETGDRNDGLLGALLVGASMLFVRRRRRPHGA
jgi:MYXO-CTERM domain-containing protein